MNVNRFFEWNEEKRQINIRKHGIDFEDVPEVFDSDILTIEDTRFDYDEMRFITVGLLKRRVIVISHTERNDRIRIISARKATKNEEFAYYQQFADKLGSN
mgnify:CR=1 FL=1